MYPGKYAQLFADRPAFIMASSGESLTYGQLEHRSNQLAHLLRAQGQAGSFQGGALLGPMGPAHPVA